LTILFSRRQKISLVEVYGLDKINGLDRLFPSSLAFSVAEPKLGNRKANCRVSGYWKAVGAIRDACQVEAEKRWEDVNRQRKWDTLKA